VNRADDIEIVVALLDKKVDCNEVDNEGLSALDYAVLNQKVEVVDVLLSHGVDRVRVESAFKKVKDKYSEINVNLQELNEVIQVAAKKGEETQETRDAIESREKLKSDKIAYKRMYEMLSIELKK